MLYIIILYCIIILYILNRRDIITVDIWRKVISKRKTVLVVPLTIRDGNRTAKYIFLGRAYNERKHRAKYPRTADRFHFRGVRLLFFSTRTIIIVIIYYYN